MIFALSIMSSDVYSVEQPKGVQAPKVLSYHHDDSTDRILVTRQVKWYVRDFSSGGFADFPAIFGYGAGRVSTRLMNVLVLVLLLVRTVRIGDRYVLYTSLFLVYRKYAVQVSTFCTTDFT